MAFIEQLSSTLNLWNYHDVKIKKVGRVKKKKKHRHNSQRKYQVISVLNPHIFKGHSHVNIYIIWGILFTKTKELLDSTNIITINFLNKMYLL